MGSTDLRQGVSFTRKIRPELRKAYLVTSDVRWLVLPLTCTHSRRPQDSSADIWHRSSWAN